MELKLKDEEQNNPQSHEWSDMGDYEDDAFRGKMNMFREPAEIEQEKFNGRKDMTQDKRKGPVYAIIGSVGMICVIVTIGAFVLSFVASLMENESKTIVKNSYVAIGTINHVDEMYITVPPRVEYDRFYTYTIKWMQQLYVEVQGKNGSYVTNITVELRSEQVDYSKSTIKTISMIKDDFKDVEVISPYKEGQEYEFYISEKNQDKIYMKDKVDENLDTSSFKRIANRIGIVTLILAVVCISVSGLPERNK